VDIADERPLHRPEPFKVGLRELGVPEGETEGAM
jgi:hypothetical protein